MNLLKSSIILAYKRYKDGEISWYFQLCPLCAENIKFPSPEHQGVMGFNIHLWD